MAVWLGVNVPIVLWDSIYDVQSYLPDPLSAPSESDELLTYGLQANSFD